MFLIIFCLYFSSSICLIYGISHRISRPFLISYYGGGTEGIVAYVEKLRAELTDAMYMCGARSLGDITRDMVRAVR